MKKNFVLSLFALGLMGSLFTSASFQQDDPDGKAGATGAPGEGTCADAGNDCHATYAVNSGPGEVSISSPDLMNWQYVPGESYTIDVTVSQTGRDLFGLGCVALKSNGDNAGTLIPGTDNWIKNKTVGGFSRKNIVQIEDMGTGSGSHTFSFTWNAPATNVGQVTFYVSGNAANGNGNESLDYIYTTSQVVDAFVGIDENENLASAISIYPNPVKSDFLVNVEVREACNMHFRVVNTSGQLVTDYGMQNLAAGKNSRSFDFSHASAGLYVLQTFVNGKLYVSEMLNKE